MMEVGGQRLELLVPARGEALLDDPDVIERFEQDEYMPYWATLWPAAVLLSQEVAGWDAAPDPAPTVVELGCGLGLVGLMALARGYAVTMTDHDEDALAFARENARRNGLPLPQTQRLDWRDPHERLVAERVLAADVLYEARNLEPVARLISRCLGPASIAYVCDPGRRTADAFERVAPQHGLDVAVSPVEFQGAPGARPLVGRVFELRRAAGTDQL